MLTVSEKIRMAAARSGVSLSELARRIGKTPQNLSQRLKRGTIYPEELEQIAAALGAEIDVAFVFPDGTRV